MHEGIEDKLGEVIRLLKEEKQVPAQLIKSLISNLIMYRAESMWMKDVIGQIITNMHETIQTSENTLDSISGVFTHEDEVFIEAYRYCSGKRIPSWNLDKTGLTVIRGGLDEDDNSTTSNDQ